MVCSLHVACSFSWFTECRLQVCVAGRRHVDTATHSMLLSLQLAHRQQRSGLMHKTLKTLLGTPQSVDVKACSQSKSHQGFAGFPAGKRSLCCLQNARKGILFEDFPPVLQLQLKRFEFDFERGVHVKVRDTCGLKSSSLQRLNLTFLQHMLPHNRAAMPEQAAGWGTTPAGAQTFNCQAARHLSCPATASGFCRGSGTRTLSA